MSSDFARANPLLHDVVHGRPRNIAVPLAQDWRKVRFKQRIDWAYRSRTGGGVGWLLWSEVELPLKNRRRGDYVVLIRAHSLCRDEECPHVKKRQYVFQQFEGNQDGIGCLLRFGCRCRSKRCGFEGVPRLVSPSPVALRVSHSDGGVRNDSYGLFMMVMVIVLRGIMTVCRGGCCLTPRLRGYRRYVRGRYPESPDGKARPTHDSREGRRNVHISQRKAQLSSKPSRF